MPSISYDSFVPWANYHLTAGTINPPSLEPCVEVDDLGRFHASDVGAITRIERFAATAATLWEHVGHVIELTAKKQLLGQLGPSPKPFPAALVGRGWSFSHIIGADKGKRRESMLMCEGLAGSIMLAADDLATEAKTRAGSIALTGGGTRFRELLEWAAPLGRTVETSGTHLGATVAGAIATATHGSRLGYGGMQDMVVGLHIITGMGQSVWIERKSAPILTEAAANRLDPQPECERTIRIIRDDAMFEDALVHLGCMGIVNCAAIELVPDSDYQVLRRDQPIDDEWLELASLGKWQEIARRLGHDRDPVFYELTVNPHAWNGPSALHTLYFRADVGTAPEDKPSSVTCAGEAIASFAEAFGLFDSAAPSDADFDEVPDPPFSMDDDEDGVELPPDPRAVRMGVFDPRTKAQSAYDHYRMTGGFQPIAKPGGAQRWKDMHQDEITGGIPGSLYNTSYAIPRADLARAFPLICDTVKDLPMSFVFTVRFVSKPAGTMAFTRHPENAVIEIDGLSPWICRRTRHGLNPGSPDYKRDRKMLKYLFATLPTGARRLMRALDRAGINYSNHFGKRGFLDKHKIQNDFGPLADPASRLSRWRATREALLTTPHGKALFWNWGAYNFGLVERPETMPPEVEMIVEELRKEIEGSGAP